MKLYSYDSINDLLIDPDVEVWVHVDDHKEALNKARQAGAEAERDRANREMLDKRLVGRKPIPNNPDADFPAQNDPIKG